MTQIKADALILQSSLTSLESKDTSLTGSINYLEYLVDNCIRKNVDTTITNLFTYSQAPIIVLGGVLTTNYFYYFILCVR